MMAPPTDLIQTIHRQLLEEYGPHPWQASDPVATLVNTILSQNTNDVNRDRAFDRMRERFPSWEEVRDVPEKELIDAVRPAGLAPTKAPRIQTALRLITEREGAIDLTFLDEMDVREAQQWLLDLPGVGPKTAAIVLLFALGKPAFPVDTHVHRVTRRLGLIPEKTNREKAHVLLEEIVPPDLYYPFHLNLIEHGRAICHARSPKCERCVLHDVCRYIALRLVLVRHGRTFANDAHQWTGWGETELTEHGHAQVAAVARRLAKEMPDATAIYTSPLSRARETAAAIADALGLEPAVLEELREINFGDMEGTTLEEMETQHPELYVRWRNKRDTEFSWPGGERRADFFRRVSSVCDEILSRHNTGTVIVVGHGGTLRSCLSHLLPEELGEWWTYAMDNCGVTEVLVWDEKAELLTLNDTSHLPEE
jgi:endonuclease-3